MRFQLAFFAVLLAACGRNPTGPATDLLVTASTSRASFRAGDTITVHVTVFNRSNQPQTIGGGGCGFLGFKVTNVDGKVVAPNTGFCSSQLVLKTLAPGDQYSETQIWTGGALGNPTGTPVQMVLPGAYTVTGGVDPVSADGSAAASSGIDYIPAQVSVTP